VFDPKKKHAPALPRVSTGQSKTAIIINVTLPLGRKIVTGIEGPRPL
jgi:hypothetical protein